MAKYAAKGTLVYFATANPPTTQSVLGIEDVEIDLGERDPLLDMTTHDNSTGVREKQDNGLKQPAKLTLSILYDPADAVHEDLRGAEQTYAAKYVKLTLPDSGAASWVGACRVASFVIGAPVDGKLTARVVIDLIGAFTFTA